MGVARTHMEPATPLTIEAVVSVQIKPAGAVPHHRSVRVCRELISDYSPDALVWITSEAGVEAIRAIDLLPSKTRRVLVKEAPWHFPLWRMI